MSMFDWLKKQIETGDFKVDDFDLSDNDVTPPKMSHEMAALATVRDFIYDSQVANYREICALLGLPPISDEVDEMERRSADKRSDRVVHLFPLLHAYAHTMTAGIIVLLQRAGGDNSPAKKQHWDRLHQIIEPTVLATLVGALSQLVEKDLLAVTSEEVDR